MSSRSLLISRTVIPAYLPHLDRRVPESCLQGMEVHIRKLRGMLPRLYRWGADHRETVVLLPPFGVSFL
jgi:hypothetical protein